MAPDKSPPFWEWRSPSILSLRCKEFGAIGGVGRKEDLRLARLIFFESQPSLRVVAVFIIEKDEEQE